MPNRVCFPKFRVPMFFLYVFLSYASIFFFLIRVTIPSIYPSVNSRRSIFLSKIFCGQFFVRRNIREKLLKAASFVNFNVASNIIAGNYVDRVWAHTQMISFSIDSLLEGSAQPPEHVSLCFGIFEFRHAKSFRIVILQHSTTPLGPCYPLHERSVETLQ